MMMSIDSSLRRLGHLRLKCKTPKKATHAIAAHVSFKSKPQNRPHAVFAHSEPKNKPMPIKETPNLNEKSTAAF